MGLQDFGEKIGGAKKDLWKDRGLMIDDLLEMNDAEKGKLIKKDNVWKKPNYQEMVNNGIPIRVVYFIKLLRDATPTKPVITYFDKSPEAIKGKQEGYIEFVGKLRDYAMNLSTENEVLNFYNDFMSEYVTYRNSYSVDISPAASDCIDNKLLNLMQIKNFLNIDREIKKKQFCYTDDEKTLAQFNIFEYTKDNAEFTKYDGRDVIRLTRGYGIYFIYPKEEFSNPNSWKENTFFIMQNGKIVINNLESIEEAQKYILDNFKDNTKTTTPRTRKKGFIPKQLENISRNGDDVRNGKDITGEDMMKNFNFKGGEFGNWLNENDRQQSLNYGFEALMDLSKALYITPDDISLGNRLSIAFGSRGSGNALAHYEPDREVINLTKMKGAGSLAHEWSHALDDIVGKNLGYKGFFTDNYRYSDSTSEVLKDMIETMKYKTVCNEETIKSQKEEYEKQLNRMKNFVNTFFPKEHLNEEQTKQKDELIQRLIDNSESASNNLVEYRLRGTGNKEIDELSKLRGETVGRVIPKDERIQLAYLQNSAMQKKNAIGTPQKIKTDFYKNSITFDDMFAKTDHGYWQNNPEMFARAFACYVYDKLGYTSDYLCGHAELALGLVPNKDGELELIKAYPEGEERTIINEKIEKFIEFLKEKEILHNYSLNKAVDTYDDYDYAF